MDFRKESRGANATKAVDLVISFYDNSFSEKDDKVTAYYGEAYGHPEAAISENQTNLALVTQRTERDGQTHYNHSVPFYPKQLEAVKAAAGDNVAPLLDKDGNRRGSIYGVKADLMAVERGGKTIGFMPNSKTLAASDLSVAEVGGKDIRTRIFEATKEAREARDAAQKTETKAPQVEAEAPAVEVAAAGPELA